MKKKILTLVLAATAASMLAGCGKDTGGREERSYEQEESSYEADEGGSPDTAAELEEPDESIPDAPSESEEPEEEPLLTSVYASAKPGNELQFGTYEQDNNLSNGAEPIDWVVLANEGDRILVLSKYVLAGGIDEKELREMGIRDDSIPDHSRVVTWATSSERKWLNNIFYEDAFSEEERSCILQSELTTPDMEAKHTGKPFRSYGGSDTTDYLFLLSYDEFVKYVKPLGIAQAEPTAASGVSPDETTGYAWGWLLRSPGLKRNIHLDEPADYSSAFARVFYSGGDVYDTRYVDDPDKWHFVDGRITQCELRMAMWLRVE